MYQKRKRVKLKRLVEVMFECQISIVGNLLPEKESNYRNHLHVLVPAPHMDLLNVITMVLKVHTFSFFGLNLGSLAPTLRMDPSKFLHQRKRETKQNKNKKEPLLSWAMQN